MPEDAEIPAIVTIGETMLLLHSQRAEGLEMAAALDVSIGGAESNVAIGARRLGVPSAWVSRLGDDSAGLRIQRDLRAEGVTVYARVDPDLPTGMMLKERRSSNATHVWYHRAGSAASRLTPADVPDGLIESARVLHLTGITPALSTDAHATARAAVGRARAAGVLVSFDVNHRGRLWSASCARPAYRDLVTASGLVFAGLDEARLILDDDLLDAEAACAELHELGAATVVIKLGGDGALLSDADGRIHRAAIPVDVVDTVGAGDAFVSGFLAALVTGADRVQALEAGIRSGALACTAAGDWEGLPRPADVEALSATEPVSR